MPSDPIETSAGADSELSWDVLGQIVDLIERMDTDWMIYATTEDIADALQSSKNTYLVGTPQREALAHRIEAVAKTKLPIERQIGHTGYRLATLAQTLRIRKRKVGGVDSGD